MSKYNQNAINILHLPEEVLEMILSYVPKQIVIGQVCKTFYKISCRLHTFGLLIFWDNFYDDENFKSIFNSKRKIDSMEFSFAPTVQHFDIDTMKKIIERFGPAIKQFKIEGFQWNLDDFSMLNLMPNLEQLELSNMVCENNGIRDYKLHLFNLRKVEILYCSLDVTQHILDRLPKDVLHKLNIACSKSLQNLNKNQSKLKKLSFDTNEDELAELSGLNELTKLKVGHCIKNISQRSLDRICEELKSLQILHIGGTDDLRDLSVLQNLTNLRKLVFSFYNAYRLVPTIQSLTLRVLHLQNASTSMFRDFSFKCPNLRELYVKSFKGLDFGDLLDLLPGLERFSCNAKSLKIAEGWENRSLKHLKINSWSKSETGMLLIVRACKNLTTLQTWSFSNDTMRQLLGENQNLKSLCFSSPTLEIAQVIKEHGEKLESLHIQHDMSTEALAKLKELFPVVKKYYLKYQYFYLMMKKKGKFEKCCDFVLEKMDDV